MLFVKLLSIIRYVYMYHARYCMISNKQNKDTKTTTEFQV